MTVSATLKGFAEIVGERKKFLLELRCWNGVATTRELGPQLCQQQNSARQWCRRKGLVAFEGGCWLLTEAGRAALAEGLPK